MAGDSKLDMSLDALIKNARKKAPAGAGAKAGGGGKKAAAGQQGAQQKKQLKKPGIKVKPGQQGGQQQQQRPGKAGLQAKGGISKAGGAAARPGVKVQQRGRQPDVRVVPRPGAAGPRPGPRGAPPPRPGLRSGYNGYGGPIMQQPPRYMAAPQMMAPMMQQPMMVAPMMPQQQPQQQAGALFDGSVVSSNTSSKLLISNLDHKVTDEDIRELFGTVGAIKESGVHYDRNGRSVGTATVVFERRTDALAAFNRYNNVALDNKKMSIEVVEQAVPRGTFKTLASGINVSRAQQAAAAAGVRGRGLPQGDLMQE